MPFEVTRLPGMCSFRGCAGEQVQIGLGRAGEIRLPTSSQSNVTNGICTALPAKKSPSSSLTLTLEGIGHAQSLETDSALSRRGSAEPRRYATPVQATVLFKVGLSYAWCRSGIGQPERPHGHPGGGGAHPLSVQHCAGAIQGQRGVL